MIYEKKLIKLLFITVLIFISLGCSTENTEKEEDALLRVDSLDKILISTLRSRDYGSKIVIESYETDSCVGDLETGSLPRAEGTYKSYMAGFSSDGIYQYARLTLPNTRVPQSGYPFILFLHGFIGQEKAPNYSIGCNPSNLYYSELTDAFARAGYAVLSPGYRGHATVNGVSAEGLEYLDAFDNGVGIMPQFYAIDALNFVSGLKDIDSSSFLKNSLKFDMSRYFLLGHSQGGDAGLTLLAAVGEGINDHLAPVQSALWSGAFLPRLRALKEVMSVTSTPESFLAGDLTWTGTAVGQNGRVNPNFIFGFPPDWIESPQPKNWSWQKENWSEKSVASATQKAAREMYRGLRKHVINLSDIKLEIENINGQDEIIHDAKVERQFSQIGGYNFANYLTEPVELHVPDKDHHSQLGWNQDLCARINNAAGNCNLVVYPDNNHSLRASPYEWFSPKGTQDGYPILIENLVLKFDKLGSE